MVVIFELPANCPAEKFITQLSDKAGAKLVSKHYSLKTFYDSFDWRLYRNGLVCELNRSRQTSTLVLSGRKTGELIASTIMFDVPSFSHQFNPGKVRKTLEPVLEMRALLPVSTLECDAYQIVIVNENEKTVVRLLVEDYELINSRVTLFPVKGHDKLASAVAEIICKDLGSAKSSRPVLLDALRLQGRHPRDYDSKLNILLTAGLSADAGCIQVFYHLLKAIKANEQGVIADIDSEFLHDYRVAVRRTRAMLSQARTVLPDEALAKAKEFFTWLNKATGETRDLDIYLLNFESYKKKLPGVIRQSINPLHSFLVSKKQSSQQQLAKKLRSGKYINQLAEWESYLSSYKSPDLSPPDVRLSAKEFAGTRIWKTYKRAIQEGREIGCESPPEALHKLRKTCKKLRYLVEFFQSLYPDRQIDKLIKPLKRLQDVLGEYQDLSVQQESLKQFSEEMHAINTPNKTFMAMGVLIQELEKRKEKVRDHFDDQFSVFRKQEYHAIFKSLYSSRRE